MRFAAAACALAIIVCVAVFGAVFAQWARTPAVPAPSIATAPAPKQATPPTVVTEIPSAARVAAPNAATPGAVAPAALPPIATAPSAGASGASTPAAAAIPDPASAPPPVTAAQMQPGPPPPQPVDCPGNRDALGVSRVVEIDTTGGPGFGFEHFKQYDFLQPNEVVLTFDDGPWPGHTPAVLAALAAHCTKAIFFPIGEHTMWAPEILKQVAAAGHTIGSHTWSHKDLSKLSFQDAKDEVEKGISAVKWALGGISPAAFFRAPDLRHPPEMVTYLGTRNIAIFSCDLDSFDFKARNAKQVEDVIFKKLGKLGKGIILMHDFHKHTAEALPAILARLKAEGYKVVAMRSKAPVQSLPQYDEEVLKDSKLPTLSQRPVSSVVTDVTQ